MRHEQIIYEVREGIATITLNRPDKLNAWTRQMAHELRAAMHTAAGDDAVRGIILTGAGRGFCAGADMNLLSGISGGTAGGEEAPAAYPVPAGGSQRADFRMPNSYFPSIPKPILGAINGPCAGLGFVVSLYCDFRFAAESAVFTTSFAQRGLIAEHGISWMLPRLVGIANAADLLYSARKIKAAEARDLGIVQRVVPDAELLAAARDYMAHIAANVSPRSVTVMKRQIWEGLFQTLSEATTVGDYEMAQSFPSEDFKEGVAHFLEKRPARFTGR
jgi:enoyl-CoA hydratase/carnithine racemase